MSVTPEGGRWAQRIESGMLATRLREPVPRSMRIEMGWNVFAATLGGDPIPQRVRGLDGFRIGNQHVYFMLPDGVQVHMMLVMVGGQEHRPTLPDLLRIAEEFDFGSWPDISWLGAR